MRKFIIILVGLIAGIVLAHAQNVNLTQGDIDVLMNGVIAANAQMAKDQSAIAADQADINFRQTDVDQQNQIVQHGQEVYQEWVASSVAEAPLSANPVVVSNSTVANSDTTPAASGQPCMQDMDCASGVCNNGGINWTAGTCQ